MVSRKHAAPRTKLMIEEFIRTASEHNIGVVGVEKGYLPDTFLEKMGLRYSTERRIKMYYTSFARRFLPDAIVDAFFQRKVLDAAVRGYGLGIGLIAQVIYENEPVYDAQTLEKELRLAKDASVKEVVIFRLGGINKEYLSVIRSVVE